MAYKVIILYQLYMPSYFLGTFTEYPYVWGIFVDGKEVERGDTDVDKSRKLFSCKSFL